MVFDTNLTFKLIGISYSDYNGDKFKQVKGVKFSLLYAYSRCWLIFTVYDFSRFLILALYPRTNNGKHGAIGYYLCDFAGLVSGKSYRYK